MEGQFPATLFLWRAQPQPHQVAAGSWRRVVLVLSTGMEHMLVRQNLDVADIEDHMQGEFEAGVFEDLGGAELGRGERWNQARVREAGKGFYVVRIPPFALVSLLLGDV